MFAPFRPRALWSSVIVLAATGGCLCALALWMLTDPVQTADVASAATSERIGRVLLFVGATVVMGALALAIGGASRRRREERLAGTHDADWR